MRNSICTLSFPISHIVFLQEKMYVVLIGLGVCFFARRVHILVKDFNDYQSLLSCRNFNVFCLYISKTIKVFCLAKTSMSSAFTFQRLSKSFVLQRLQCLLPLHFKDYESLLSYKYFYVFCPLYFKDCQSLLSCRGFNVFRPLHFKDFNVFCQDFNIFFTFQRLQCLLSRLQCLLYISKTSMSFVKTSMSSLHFKDFNVFC